MSFYPPYFGAGVKVRLIDEENLIFKVSMPLTPLNKNYVGTHFGGSLYSMVDPFFMLILMNKLGKNYLVWDKSACIEFRKPGKGRVSAIFNIPNERVEEIRSEVEEKGKVEPIFKVDILNEDGGLVASAEKKLWVKKKDL